MNLEDLIRRIIEKQKLCKKWFGFTNEDFYTKEQLTETYRELAKKHHADITKGTDDDMKAINEAYALLKPFAKDPKDRKYTFHDNNIKTLKDDFETLFNLLYQPYFKYHYTKTGKRLYNNKETIIEQIKPIYDTLKDKFELIDVYLHNNPNSSIVKYIKDKFYKMTHTTEIILWSSHSKHVSNINLAANNFSLSVIEYRKGFIYHTDNTKGTKRNNMRKCRNEALVALISFAKEMQNILLIINNGFVEHFNNYNNTKEIINLTYMADYEKLNNSFENIRKSGNYFCYISEEEKNSLSKKLKNI